MNSRLGLLVLLPCLLPGEEIVQEAKLVFRDASRIRVAGGLGQPVQRRLRRFSSLRLLDSASRTWRSSIPK